MDINSGLVDKITTGATGAVQEVDYEYYPATSGRFLWKIFNRKTAGGTLISRHQYTYGTGTEFGQIKTWDRELPLSAGGYSINTQTFGNDAIGQLKTAAETTAGTSLPPRSYNYDPAGNRTSKSEGGTGTTYGTANDVNQIITATGGDGVTTTAYDPNGNLTSIEYSDGSRRILDWDSINRLKQLTSKRGPIQPVATSA